MTLLFPLFAGTAFSIPEPALETRSETATLQQKRKTVKKKKKKRKKRRVVRRARVKKPTRSKSEPKMNYKKRTALIGDTVRLDTLPLTNELHYRWHGIGHKGEPWVKNVSRPYSISQGLYNHHVALWASHGRYYDQKKDMWRWQRPNLYCTTEDLFTQTIVIPYLIPMLENAGAVVFTPRERDWQKHEVIVDNDMFADGISYLEIEGDHEWKTTGAKGFAYSPKARLGLENPFKLGTARRVKTTTNASSTSNIIYQPTIPESGRYAVYVSYQTEAASVDDAKYTVWHKGQPTVFKVNQQMGGGTWVYLGTFDFDKGNSSDNRVELSNISSRSGVVTADAVRFGGGMGNIERAGNVSGFPRCLEAARYYAQWAGMPDTIYTEREETNDYKDDINVRSKMTNYVGGGSCYMPTLEGLKVPLEVSVGVHSDAGYHLLYDSLKSTLGICTTNNNDTLLNSRISRYASYELISDMLGNITRDLNALCGDWYNRGIWNRNYSETRRPEVPSVIIETLSHQSFLDMEKAHDPNLRHDMARAIYKTLLRHIAKQHDVPYVVSPLAPDNFRIGMNGSTLTLRWDAVLDPLEETARPTAYIVYTSIDGRGYDNGVVVGNLTADGGATYSINATPGALYRFRVAALNAGGESFPTEELCAQYNTEATKTIAIVNGFHRLSAPDIVKHDSIHGFNMDTGAGISLGPTFGWVGRQMVFERGKETQEEFFTGYSNDDFAGLLIAGNDMNYAATHAEAIAANGKYNIVSCSSHFIDNDPEMAKAYLGGCQMVDLILGLQYDNQHGLKRYKSFSHNMQHVLSAYTRNGNPLLVSGAHVGRDMTTIGDCKFLADVLKCYHAGIYHTTYDLIRGMGTTIEFYNSVNEEHYAALTADVLQPTNGSFAMLLFGNGNSAGVAYQGNDYRAITLGIPFECITDKKKQKDIMGGLLKFLIKQ